MLLIMILDYSKGVEGICQFFIEFLRSKYQHKMYITFFIISSEHTQQLFLYERQVQFKSFVRRSSLCKNKVSIAVFSCWILNFVWVYIIIRMSHLKIQRKRTQDIRIKMHSQQSRTLKPPHSLTRIVNENILKRRRTTNPSPDHSLEANPMISQIEEAKQTYKSKNTKQALILFKKVYKKYPKNSQIPYFIGSCLLNEGNFESALTYFKACLQLEPNFNKNIFIFMAICYKAQSKFKQAILTLQMGLQKYPRFKDGYFYKGKMHMKLQQFSEAAMAFKKCIKIQPLNNQLAYMLLGDCLVHLGQLQQALQKYTTFLQISDNNCEKAYLKKINLMIELKRIKQALTCIENATTKGVSSIELIFLKGLCEYELGNYSEAITCFQLTLASNALPVQITKALRNLIQISIKQKDFFGAEHLVSRSKFMNINQEEFILYHKLVEGINDLIKRKLNQCEQKLAYVYKNTLNKSQPPHKFLLQASSPYYAYCLFSLEKYDKALEVYKVNLKENQKDGTKKLEKYNKLICEGVILHKNNEYRSAEQKFRQASNLIQNKVQPIFLMCINLVQESRKKLGDEKVREKVCDKLNKLFKQAEQSNSTNSLFLFYQSLAILFENENACKVIDQAIALSEEQVSQYYFIQALSYSLAGQSLKGLECITKAIELDQSIPEFFKERSKYYYILERYDEAVTDIVKVLDETNDQQAKLLLTFYYYMVDQYGLALQLLKEVSEQCQEEKFKEFEMALHFRVNMFHKCGAIGNVINAIINKKKLTQEFITKNIKTCIQEKQGYSQFTTFHFHLVLSAYYFYFEDFDMALQNLFGAIEVIQTNFQSEQQFAALSEDMLNQIKFNITLTCLSKQSHEAEAAEPTKYSDTSKYIEMFIKQTQDLDFISCMKSILKTLDEIDANPHNEVIRHIELYADMPKISSTFPEITIPLRKNYLIKTKFLMTYPQKLKFNIAPQFDETFLYNFDIDKVDTKLCPPWFKLHEGKIFFTDKIRNQSVLISQTERGPTPALIVAPSPQQNLREKFKLDDAVEKKLEKLMKARERKSDKKIP